MNERVFTSLDEPLSMLLTKFSNANLIRNYPSLSLISRLKYFNSKVRYTYHSYATVITHMCADTSSIKSRTLLLSTYFGRNATNKPFSSDEPSLSISYGLSYRELALLRFSSGEGQWSRRMILGAFNYKKDIQSVWDFISVVWLWKFCKESLKSFHAIESCLSF